MQADSNRRKDILRGGLLRKAKEAVIGPKYEYQSCDMCGLEYYGIKRNCPSCGSRHTGREEMYERERP